MDNIKKPIILCREYDKFQGRPPVVYKVCDVSDSCNLFYYQLRSRFNPELAYFIVLEDDWLENEDFVKDRILREHEFEAFDDFIGNGSILESSGIVRI